MRFGLLLLLLAQAANAASAWTWVHTATTSPGSAASVSLAVTAGDLIVCGFVPGVSDPNDSPQDSVNGIYTKIARITNNRPAEMGIYAKVATTTATLTINHTQDGTSRTYQCANFANATGTIPGTANTFVTDINVITETLTTTAADTLLIGITDASTSNTVCAGFTVIGAESSGTRITTFYGDLSTANSAGSNTVCSTSGGTTRGIIAVAFNPPSTSTSIVHRAVIQ